MMRILFVVPYAPNPVRTRPYHFLRALRAQGHEITLLTLSEDATEAEDLASLEAIGVTVVAEKLAQTRALGNAARAALSREPMQAAYCWQPALARQLESLLRPAGGETSFDVVHVEHLRGARYGILARSILGPDASIPVVWDSVDCISLLFRQAVNHSTTRFGRWVTRIELPRTERFEAELLTKFDNVLASTSADRDALASLNPGQSSIHVVPNGVDLDRFSADPSVRREPSTLVFSGKMSYHANETMALALVRDIMPRVWKARPEARVVLVGKDPGPAVRRLAADSRVEVTGSVSDLRPYLQRSTLAVAPVIYGTGIQNKILEAMACATPVVTTPRAAAALKAVIGRDLLLGEDPAELARVIVELLAAPDLQARVGAAGRDYVVMHHSWDKISVQLESVYREALAQSRASQPARAKDHQVGLAVNVPPLTGSRA